MPLKLGISLYPSFGPSPAPGFKTTLYSMLHGASMATVVFQVWYSLFFPGLNPTIQVLIAYSMVEDLERTEVIWASSVYRLVPCLQFKMLPGFTPS